MPYGFNDDRSKADLSDVVRTSDITDVVRTSDITDVVRTNDIADVVRSSDITDVVRMSDITDVVRMSDITDVVRTGDIEQKVYNDQITIDGSSANFTIDHSSLVVQGNIAYIYISLNVNVALTAGSYYVPIKLPNNMKLLRAMLGTPQTIGSNDTRYTGHVDAHASNWPALLPDKDVLYLLLTEAWPTTNPPLSFYGIVMLQE